MSIEPSSVASPAVVDAAVVDAAVVDQSTVDAFHHLYYNTPGRTWTNTYWMGNQVLKYPLWIYQEILYDMRFNRPRPCRHHRHRFAYSSREKSYMTCHPRGYLRRSLTMQMPELIGLEAKWNE